MGRLSYIYFWRWFLAVFQHNKIGALQKAMTVLKKYEQLNTVELALFVGVNVLKVVVDSHTPSPLQGIYIPECIQESNELSKVILQQTSYVRKYAP